MSNEKTVLSAWRTVSGWSFFRYRECVNHYAKYKHAGIIETEASLKAVMILVKHRFLTNVYPYELAHNLLWRTIVTIGELGDKRYRTAHRKGEDRIFSFGEGRGETMVLMLADVVWERKTRGTAYWFSLWISYLVRDVMVLALICIWPIDDLGVFCWHQNSFKILYSSTFNSVTKRRLNDLLHSVIFIIRWNKLYGTFCMVFISFFFHLQF